ncbi:MAG: MFS transporter [Clostridia bacterium]|nr:MFS transporter [Clostridia bacterium]
MKKSQTLYTIIASFSAMLIMAITESIRGILVPTFKETFNVNDTSIGIFLLIASFAYVVFTYFAGKMVKHHGQRKTIILGMLIAGSGFFFTSFSQNFIHLVAGYIYLTMGISFIVMSLNTIVPLLRIAYLGVIMNSLHFFYGVGATITQRVSGYLISHDVSWRTIFVGFACLYIIGIVIFLFVKQPPMKEEHHSKSKIHKYEVQLIVFFSMALGFYITAEIQTSNWLVNYLKGMYQFTENKGSFYVAFFFGALALGRLFGGYILEKIGYLKGLIGTLMLAFVFYLVGLINEETLILLSISGVFFSVVYPTTVLVLQHLFEHNVSKVLSIVTMAASCVSMVFGFVIGGLNDMIGLRLSYMIVPASILISLLFMIGIAIEIKKVENKRLESE